MRAYREIGLPELWESLGPFYGASFRAFVDREVLRGAPPDPIFAAQGSAQRPGA